MKKIYANVMIAKVYNTILGEMKKCLVIFTEGKVYEGALFWPMSPDDMIILQRHGFRVTTWCVETKCMKKLNDMETIFLMKEATLVGHEKVDELYLKELQRIIPTI